MTLKLNNWITLGLTDVQRVEWQHAVTFILEKSATDYCRKTIIITLLTVKSTWITIKSCTSFGTYYESKNNENISAATWKTLSGTKYIRLWKAFNSDWQICISRKYNQQVFYSWLWNLTENFFIKR